MNSESKDTRAGEDRRGVTHSPSRLLLLDLLRGLALLIVLVDHIDVFAGDSKVFMSWTPVAWGYSDASEYFVIISGFTFGYVYTLRLGQRGLLPCLKNVIQRAQKVYVSYVAICGLLILQGCLSESFILTRCLRDPFVLTWGELMKHTVLLTYQPFCMQILAFYCIVFPPMLLALAAARRHAALVLLISCVVYVAAQVNSGINLPDCRSVEGWFFNPFAWQFLFLISMFAGRFHASNNALPSRIRRILYWVSLAIVVTGCVDRMWTDGALPAYLSAATRTDIQWYTSKSHAGLFRIVHAFALLGLVAASAVRVPAPRKVQLKRLLKPVISTGQMPLFAYCGGVLLTYQALFGLEPFERSVLTVVAAGLGAVLVTLMACRAMDSASEKRS